MIYLLIFTGILIASLEIYIDKKIWKASGNDKPFTTIGRLVLIAILATFYNYDTIIWNYLVMLMSFFLVFDWGLNISRWKTIEGIFYYRPYHSRYKLYIDLNYKEEWAHRKTLSKLTNIEYLIYHFMNIKSKVFYHGVDKPKWSYDWYYQRIAPVFELMIKGICFGMAVYFYIVNK